MRNYTIIPKSIIDFNMSLVDVYIWSIIKRYSDYKTNLSFISENKLSLITGLNEKTIKRSIKHLKDLNYIEVKFYKHNYYYIKSIDKNYFLVENSFFDNHYPAKISGLLLLLKSICINDTNIIKLSDRKISKILRLSRNTVSLLLKQCIDLKLIKKNIDGYELIIKFFKNSLSENKQSIKSYSF